MDLGEFKKKYVQEELGVTDNFGKILTFIDFGNVNYWFAKDRQTHEYVSLKDGEKFFIDLEKLKDFLCIFSNDIRFYYGYDSSNSKSTNFIQKSEDIFSKKRVFTKEMQKVRHHIESQNEKDSNTRKIHRDGDGEYIHLPKCNFDVEISVDAIKTMQYYDTICLLSGDADFVHLLRYLKQKGKKVILIKGGHIVHQLREISNLVINAQDIKKYISDIKEESKNLA